MDFRHPATIQEQIARLVKRRHDVETELSVVGKENPKSGKLLMELTILAGALMALEWSACARVDLDADYQKLIQELP